MRVHELDALVRAHAPRFRLYDWQDVESMREECVGSRAETLRRMREIASALDAEGHPAGAEIFALVGRAKERR